MQEKPDRELLALSVRLLVLGVVLIGVGILVAFSVTA